MASATLTAMRKLTRSSGDCSAVFAATRRCIASALRGIMRAVEHRKETVTGILDEVPAISRNAGIEHFRTQAHQPGMRRFLVQLRQPTVANDVGGKNGDKATLRR